MIGDGEMEIRRHNIFLSHSGSQKDFVEQLCEDLERAKQSPFFDKRPHSLPKGEEFAPIIFTATQECELAVVVLSQEYFTRSKWPMVELVKIVQAPGCTILPLFYRLSCKEFKNPKRRERWFQVWDGWSKSDNRISLDVWRDALRELEGRNGMEYVKGIGEVSYRKDIVATISDVMQRRSQEETISVERAVAASDEYELGTATSTFNRKAFACLQSTLFLALQQVAIFLTFLLLLIGYDHYTLDPKALPSHDLCHCPLHSEVSTPSHTINATHAFPTCKAEEEEEWNFACCYNSALQQDLIWDSDVQSYCFKDNDTTMVFVEPERTFQYWTQKYSCNSANELLDVFLNTGSRLYGSEQLSEPLSIHRSFLPRTMAFVDACAPNLLGDLKLT